MFHFEIAIKLTFSNAPEEPNRTFLPLHCMISFSLELRARQTKASKAKEGFFFPRLLLKILLHFAGHL